MKALVTGGSGFLGSKLAIRLHNEGHSVTTLSRSENPDLIKRGIKHHCVDLTDSHLDLKDILEGIDVVFHTAAKVGMWGKWNDFYQTNYLATKNLLEQSDKNKVRFFVYTSTPSVVFETNDIENASEEMAYAKESKSLYAKSKILAEKTVLSKNSKTFKTIALRPHLIFGPGDKNIIPRLIKRAQAGRLKIVGKGKNKVDVIHIDNAVEAHICALNKLTHSPQIVEGQAFFLGQEKPVLLWDFINQILERHNIKAVRSSIPFGLAYFLGATFEFIFTLFRIKEHEPPMTRFVAMQLAKSHYFSHENSSTKLGYRPVLTIEKAIESLEKPKANPQY